MKAIIEFNLPKDQAGYELCNNAAKLHSALWTVYNLVRDTQKHGAYSLEQLCDRIMDEIIEFTDL